MFFVCKTALFGPEFQVSMVPRPLSTYLWFCAYETATLGPELQVSMVPDLTCRFVHAKQRD